MTVAMTGATGFLGGHVLTRLVDAGHTVRALTRRAQPERQNVTWIAGALDDDAALAELCNGAAAIVHVAGVVSGDATTFDAGNRVGTLAVLRAAKDADVARFVHVSSLAAREPQLSMYGASKRAAEDAVVASSLDWQIVRPPAIYGPGDTENLELFRFAKRGLVPLPPGGRMSVIHADDMAELIVALLGTDAANGLYEPDDGMPGGWSHGDFARAIGSAVGRKVLTIPLPVSLVRVAAMLDGRLRGTKAKLTPDRATYFCHPDWTVDPARRPPPELWRPRITTAAGLAATATWYRETGWL